MVVAVDGGRIRERKAARNGRRRAKTGHRGRYTPRREPKQLVVYVIDSRTGKVEQQKFFLSGERNLLQKEKSGN